MQALESASSLPAPDVDSPQRLLDPALQRLIDETDGASRILVGSDCPFHPGAVDARADLDRADVALAVTAVIASANARRCPGLGTADRAVTPGQLSVHEGDAL